MTSHDEVSRAEFTVSKEAKRFYTQSEISAHAELLATFMHTPLKLYRNEETVDMLRQAARAQAPSGGDASLDREYVKGAIDGWNSAMQADYAWLEGVQKNRVPPKDAHAQAAICTTCNGHGMIGGPSYRDPGEGGEPCPDCAQAASGEFVRCRCSNIGECDGSCAPYCGGGGVGWVEKPNRSQVASGEPVAWQIRLPKSADTNWRTCSKEEYEKSILTGHAWGLKHCTMEFELRKLCDKTPAPSVSVEALEELAERWMSDNPDHPNWYYRKGIRNAVFQLRALIAASKPA